MRKDHRYYVASIQAIKMRKLRPIRGRPVKPALIESVLHGIPSYGVSLPSFFSPDREVTTRISFKKTKLEPDRG